MKYRKKPVKIEAFQFDGDMMTSDGKYYVSDWVVAALNDNVLFFKDDGELYINTLEGDIHASICDYIIRGVHGELYACNPDIFEETYELVEE